MRAEAFQRTLTSTNWSLVGLAASGVKLRLYHPPTFANSPYYRINPAGRVPYGRGRAAAFTGSRVLNRRSRSVVVKARAFGPKAAECPGSRRLIAAQSVREYRDPAHKGAGVFECLTLDRLDSADRKAIAHEARIGLGDVEGRHDSLNSVKHSHETPAGQSC
jgi:hypothetical protein